MPKNSFERFAMGQCDDVKPIHEDPIDKPDYDFSKILLATLQVFEPRFKKREKRPEVSSPSPQKKPCSMMKRCCQLMSKWCKTPAEDEHVE